MRRVVLILFSAYKYSVSPLLHALCGPGAGCRFVPSCSEYAAAAVLHHGLRRGGWLAIRRMIRCHPWSSWGYDPVPVNGACGCRSLLRKP